MEEWAARPGRQRVEHWQDGRSAKELAKAWQRVRRALIALLDFDPATAGLSIDRAIAEAQTALRSAG